MLVRLDRAFFLRGQSFFYHLFFSMSATTQGSEVGCVEAETSDGSASTVTENTEVMTEKPTEVAPG